MEMDKDNNAIGKDVNLSIGGIEDVNEIKLTKHR